jgi:hypothetical protein
MKKIIITFLICLPLSLMAQSDTTKRDTTIQLKMNINQFRALLGTIDANIDSKSVSKSLLEFLQKSAQMVQPADKPKIGKP